MSPCQPFGASGDLISGSCRSNCAGVTRALALNGRLALTREAQLAGLATTAELAGLRLVEEFPIVREIGRATPEQTAEGIQMFAICAKRETKSDTPEMKEIRDQMFQQKFGAQAKRYLETLRRQAMIEYKTPEEKAR